MNIRAALVAKLRFRNSRTFTMGLGWAHSQTRAPTMQTTITIVKTTMSGELNQSSCCPLSRMICRLPKARATRPRPSQSTFSPRESFFSCSSHGGSSTTIELKNSEAIPTGTLM